MAVCLFVITFCVLPGLVIAREPDIFAYDERDVEPGEIINVLIHVECHSYEANYTVKVTIVAGFVFVEEASDMDISEDTATITYLGDEGETLDFKFPMMVLNETRNGNYDIPYEAYWNGSETGFVQELVKSDSVRISVVGEEGESPCSSTDFILVPILGLGTAYCIVKRQKR